MEQNLKTISKRLSTLSHRLHSNPSADIDWPDKLEGDYWYMAPELMGLYGTKLWDQLSEAELKRHSFWELVNFFSLIVNGERLVVEGFTKRLFADTSVDMGEFVHHFVDEENKHIQYFGRFCTQYAHKVYLDPNQYLPPGEDDLVFLTKVMIFEQISDHYNVAMMDDERLHPVVQQINRLHHFDEARHIAFGRRAVVETFNALYGNASAEKLATMREYLQAFIDSAWESYFNPKLYEDAGIDKAYSVAQIAQRTEASAARFKASSHVVLDFLRRNGVLEGSSEPEPHSD